MSEETTKGPDSRLQVEFPLVIEKGDKQCVASVAEISENAIKLTLSKGGKALKFKEEEQVRLKYWDQRGVYFCAATVVSSSGSEVAVSIIGEPVAMQRRGGVFRLFSEIPIAFKVTEAVHKGLASQKVYESQTRNISAGGLSFDTTIPLKETDLLELELTLPSSEKIGTAAEVVTAEKVQREGKSLIAIGVEFFELPAETRGQLLEFLVEGKEQERQKGKESEG